MIFWLVLWVFRVFQHHTPITMQTPSEMISLRYALQFKLKLKEKKMAIYLDDYRPLIRASVWLLQTTCQMCGTVYFSDLRGHKHFLAYGLFIIIHLFSSCLPAQYAANAKLVCRVLWAPKGVVHSGEGIFGCPSHNAKLFERSEHAGIR